ncbi:MICOS complex subunit MIC25 isoform X3 [Pelodiscus sinensis]|uniref:MICOS complex subunit MIC25 isoform X3 n=1 Tax=Pelodiscus sinensis TaxID=13735 RepID=UPI0003C483B8|nr:MICOS complex subunit MIC25 isoform X1 [Pelodiscus sinensis]|eukprot:XP_006120270.1 MICOS complex subunit MIC25 isoform X1 [Pelodiscus sinensis]
MGGSESSYGNRKVSFGLDEQERVRVLQGIRLSEDVVNRMKETPQLKGDQRPSSFSSSSYDTASPPQAAEGKPKSTTEVHPPTTSSSGRKPSEAEEDLYKRYEREQALVQEELLRLAKRERESANECLSTTLQREKNNTNEEKQKAAQLARELQCKEAELKRRDAFCKEQLARIERKNAEIYKLTSEQFHETATNAENHINVLRDGERKWNFPFNEQRPDLAYSVGGGEEDLKSWISCVHSLPSHWTAENQRRRNTEPLCAGLQSEILKCYQENKHEVLKCSELAKEYQRCVSAAQKDLLVNYE